MATTKPFPCPRTEDPCSKDTAPGYLQKMQLQLNLEEDELKSQISTFDHLDNKTGVILGFALIAVTQLILSVPTLSALSSVKMWEKGCLLAALASFSLAALFGILELAPKTVHYGPRVSDQSVTDLERIEQLQRDELRGFRDNIIKNEPIVEGKESKAHWTAIFVLTGMWMLIAAAAGLTLGK